MDLFFQSKRIIERQTTNFKGVAEDLQTILDCLGISYTTSEHGTEFAIVKENLLYGLNDLENLDEYGATDNYDVDVDTLQDTMDNINMTYPMLIEVFRDMYDHSEPNVDMVYVEFF